MPDLEGKPLAQLGNGSAGLPEVKDIVSSRFTFAPQPDCRLLQLPRELRDKVYDFFFSSMQITVDTFGRRRNDRVEIIFRLAAFSLAMLRVCRQTFEETDSLWIGRVLFSFEDGIPDFQQKSLLESFPSNTLSQIRHVRTQGPVMPISDPPGVIYSSFGRDLFLTLQYVPGLRLDTLTVLSSSTDHVDYLALDFLVQHGNGWRELHYITEDSAMLAFKKRTRWRRCCRKPQPSTWRSMLLSRDGLDSQGTVVIYQATEGKAIGATFNETNSSILTQDITPPETLESFGVEKDAHIISGGLLKELLVIAKRGPAVNISAPPHSWPHGPSGGCRI